MSSFSPGSELKISEVEKEKGKRREMGDNTGGDPKTGEGQPHSGDTISKMVGQRENGKKG